VKCHIRPGISQSPVIMRVLLTTAASVCSVNFCECCNSPRCWLKISYSYALKPSIHAVLLLFRRGFWLSGQRQMSRPMQGFVKLIQRVSLSDLHRIPCSRGSDTLGRGFQVFALLRPLRFMPDSRISRMRYDETLRPTGKWVPIRKVQTVFDPHEFMNLQPGRGLPLLRCLRDPARGR